MFKLRINTFFLILLVLLVFVSCNNRANRLVDKVLQVYEINLDKALKEKERE